MRANAAALNAARAHVRCHDRHLDQLLPRVSIERWRSDAIVVHDWVISVDLNSLHICRPAEK